MFIIINNVAKKPEALNFAFFNQFTVIFHTLMAGFRVFFPFRMVLADKLNDVFFCFDVRDAGKIINVAVANLAAVFHYLMQSVLQQQTVWSQFFFPLAKQTLKPSLLWMVRIRSFLANFQVSLMPKFFAFFSTSESLIIKPSLRFLA